MNLIKIDMSFIFFLILFFCNPLYGIGFDEFDNFKSDLPLCSQLEDPKNYYHKCFGKKNNSDIYTDDALGYYEGEWLYDLPNGIGKMDAGDEYIVYGFYKDGLRHGDMKFVHKTKRNCINKIRYLYDFRHGYLDYKCGDDVIKGNTIFGKGSGQMFQLVNGLKIEGSLRNDKVHGYADLKNQDKTQCSHTGYYINGKRHGQNKAYDCPVKNKYSPYEEEGFYINDQMVNGETFYLDGTLRSKGIFSGNYIFNGKVYIDGRVDTYIHGQRQ